MRKGQMEITAIIFILLASMFILLFTALKAQDTVAIRVETISIRQQENLTADLNSLLGYTCDGVSNREKIINGEVDRACLGSALDEMYYLSQREYRISVCPKDERCYSTNNLDILSSVLGDDPTKVSTTSVAVLDDVGDFAEVTLESWAG